MCFQILWAGCKYHTEPGQEAFRTLFSNAVLTDEPPFHRQPRLLAEMPTNSIQSWRNVIIQPVRQRSAAMHISQLIHVKAAILEVLYLTGNLRCRYFRVQIYKKLNSFYLKLFCSEFILKLYGNL